MTDTKIHEPTNDPVPTGGSPVPDETPDEAVERVLEAMGHQPEMDPDYMAGPENPRTPEGRNRVEELEAQMAGMKRDLEDLLTFFQQRFHSLIQEVSVLKATVNLPHVAGRNCAKCGRQMRGAQKCPSCGAARGSAQGSK